MSSQTPIRRTTVPQISARKGGEPIVSLTSYHAHTAAIVDDASTQSVGVDDGGRRVGMG